MFGVLRNVFLFDSGNAGVFEGGRIGAPTRQGAGAGAVAAMRVAADASAGAEALAGAGATGIILALGRRPF